MSGACPSLQAWGRHDNITLQPAITGGSVSGCSSLDTVLLVISPSLAQLSPTCGHEVKHHKVTYEASNVTLAPWDDGCHMTPNNINLVLTMSLMDIVCRHIYCDLFSLTSFPHSLCFIRCGHSQLW